MINLDCSVMYFKEKENLDKKYKNDKEPIKNFTFNRKIWLPKNYKIEKLSNGYGYSKYVKYKNSTRYPFWRWSNFFIRTWVYICNLLYLFGVKLFYRYKIGVVDRPNCNFFLRYYRLKKIDPQPDLLSSLKKFLRFELHLFFFNI